MKLHFVKYHGAGNDFIMVDNREEDRKISDALSPGTVAALCRRHHGIGADGMIVILKTGDKSVPYEWNFYNADGTPSEMCGNGLRCMMRFLSDLGEPVEEAEEVSIRTGAGVIACRFVENGRIRVAMPIPSFDPRDAKIEADSEMIRGAITVPGLEDQVTGTAVGVGNPHFVIYKSEMWEGDEVVAIGRRLSIHKDLFPEGVNVGFARKEASDTVALVVYERGVGPTLACGSGAIAAVGAGIVEGRFEFERPVRVRMPGGELRVIIGDEWSAAVLEGEAQRVYEGIVEV